MSVNCDLERQFWRYITKPKSQCNVLKTHLKTFNVHRQNNYSKPAEATADNKEVEALQLISGPQLPAAGAVIAKEFPRRMNEWAVAAFLLAKLYSATMVMASRNSAYDVSLLIWYTSCDILLAKF